MTARHARLSMWSQIGKASALRPVHEAAVARERARDAIAAGCATADEWAAVMGAVAAAVADIDCGEPYEPTFKAHLTEWDRIFLIETGVRP